MTDHPILAFDTSGAHCQACVMSQSAVLAQAHQPMTKGQAEHLMPMLEDLLAQAGLGFGDLGRLAVGIGPGNFTGVRISVAAARGLALSLGIPAIGVNGLEAQSFGTQQPHISFLTATKTATRHTVYWQVFDGQGGAPTHGAFDEMPRHLPLLGPIEGSLMTQQSEIEAIAQIASARPADGPRPAPLYLRAPDAAPPRDPAPVILD